jgi:D-glycero-D-manno-heptose 1,7-bisphosphate phosphatase
MLTIGSHHQRPALSGQKPKRTSSRALFLDRDGVLNVDTGFPHIPSEVVFVQETIQIIKWSKSHGFITIVITNQSGIGRGFFTEADFRGLMNWMRDRLLEQGAELHACYFSPSLPDANQDDAVFNRKPDPEMIKAALDDFNLNPVKSAFIGDRDTDVRAAVAARIGQVFKLPTDEQTSLAYNGAALSMQALSLRQVFDSLRASHICDLFCASK